ncbi:hypothetical protein K438DRAFT_1768602 [Mycena galopus ATCC 62051]|nr:hypothetical protein K438DRAFT_1768602 [Mycena galopus ATCC 62051]
MAPTTNKRSIRADAPTTRIGHGAHHTSPLKARTFKKKSIVTGIGHAQKMAQLRAEIDALQRGARGSTSSAPAQSLPGPAHTTSLEDDAPMEDQWVDTEPAAPLPPLPPRMRLVPRPVAVSHGTRAQRAAQQLALAWETLLPHLEEPYAQYQQKSHAKAPSVIPSSLHHQCTVSCGSPINVNIQCLLGTDSSHYL